MKTLYLSLIFVLAGLTLAACGGLGGESSYPDKQAEDYKKYGSVVSEEGGFTLFGTDRKAPDQGSGIGVNGYLWRASLDTLSFMPLASADPFGGVILTDWYVTAQAPDERVKVSVYILSRELRADGLKVTVFRQKREADGQWADTTPGTETADKLEETILTRARRLKIAQIKE